MPPEVSNLIAAITTLVSSLNEQSGVPSNSVLNQDPRFNSDKTKVNSNIYLPVKLGEIKESDEAWNTISKIFAKTQLSAPNTPEPVASPAAAPVFPSTTEVVRENNISSFERETILTPVSVETKSPIINFEGFDKNFDILSNAIKGLSTPTPQPIIEVISPPVASPIINLQSPEVSIPAGPDFTSLISAINAPVASPIINLQSPEVSIPAGPDFNPLISTINTPVASPIINLQSPEVNTPAGPDFNPLISAINKPVASPIINLQAPEVASPIINLQIPKVASPIINLQSPEVSIPAGPDFNPLISAINKPVTSPIINLQSPEVSIPAGPDFNPLISAINKPVASPIINLQSPELPSISSPDIDFNSIADLINSPIVSPVINLQGPEVYIPAAPSLIPALELINKPAMAPIINLQSPAIPSISSPDINLSNLSGIMEKTVMAPVINLESPDISIPPSTNFIPIIDAISKPAAASIINLQSPEPLAPPTELERLVLPANTFTIPETNIDSVAESISNIKLPATAPVISFSINDGSVDLLKNLTSKISQTLTDNSRYFEYNGDKVVGLMSDLTEQKPLKPAAVNPQVTVITPSQEMPAPVFNVQVPKQDTTYTRGTYEELKVQTQLLSKIADKTGITVPQASNTNNSTVNQSIDNPPVGVPLFSSTKNNLLNFDIVGQSI